MTLKDITGKTALTRVKRSVSGRSLLCAGAVFAAGILCAWCVCAGLANWTAGKTAELMVLEADRTGRIKPSAAVQDSADFKLLVSTDPFGAGRVKTDKTKSAKTAESIRLTGTLSPAAAYLDGGEGSELILVGQDFMGFKLVSVGAGEAVIEKDGSGSSIYMPLTASGSRKNAPSAKPSSPKGIWGSSKPKKTTVPGVKAASPGAKGSVTRELVDKLLMNPYDEIAKVRMVPTENGMKIARIAGDSVLASVGVRQEDIIKAVNGVNIANLGDATNAINSMMTGNKLDITVQRDNSPVELSYEIN